MRLTRRGLALTLLAWGLAGAALASPRVLSLDQCADQYVLALAPRADIVGLSHRSNDPDAYLREAARGLPQRRASYEAAVQARPDVVVRHWGGDAALVRALEGRGVRVLTVNEAQDFRGVEANLRQVGAGLGRPAGAERLIVAMRARLRRSEGAWRDASAFYMTPGAFTAGSGTLVDSVLKAAGFRNAVEGDGFRPAPLEQLVLEPPRRFVLGFFDTVRFARWQVARHPVLERLRAHRTAAALPAKLLGCPAWFAADAVEALARAAPR